MQQSEKHRVSTSNKLCYFIWQQKSNFMNIKDSFSEKRISSEGLVMLLNTLKECKSEISSLNLLNCYLTEDCMEPLGQFIQASDHIEEISIGNFEKTFMGEITDESIRILSENIAGNTSLKSLIISECYDVTDDSIPYFIEIAKKTSITNMEAICASISSEGDAKIEKAFNLPIDEREIPIQSSTKSAAKSSDSSSKKMKQ